MSDSRTQSGGCLCGTIRYELNQSALISAHSCYCKDCQKCTGSGHSTFLMMPEAAVTLKAGDLKSYQSMGYSGCNVVRFFCPNCGSPILSECEVVPGLKMVKVGTLDDSSWVKVKSGFWNCSVAPWDQPEKGLPMVEKNE